MPRKGRDKAMMVQFKQSLHAHTDIRSETQTPRLHFLWPFIDLRAFASISHLWLSVSLSHGMIMKAREL